MDGNLQFTKREIKSVAVEAFLDSYGLKEPAQQRWTIEPIAGCVFAFGNVVLPHGLAQAAEHAGGL